MKGPDLLSKNRNAPLTKSSSNVYRTIQQKPGSARSTDIFFLDPKLTYWFQVIPKARTTNGEPSKSQRIGPGIAQLSVWNSSYLIVSDEPTVVTFLVTVCRVDGRWRTEWSCYCWHCSRHPLQPSVPSFADWPHLPWCLLHQEQK